MGVCTVHTPSDHILTLAELHRNHSKNRSIVFIHFIQWAFQIAVLNESRKTAVFRDVLMIFHVIGASSDTHYFSNEVGIGFCIDVFDDDARSKAITLTIRSSLNLEKELDPSQGSYSKGPHSF